MRAAVTIGFVLSLAALLVFGPSTFDAYFDRQHRLIAERSLGVYQTAEPPWLDHSNPLVATIEQDTALPVTRIRYEKDYMVVRVKLPNGHEGFVFSSDRFRLDPPDNR
jgi:hypothetical protein